MFVVNEVNQSKTFGRVKGGLESAMVGSVNLNTKLHSPMEIPRFRRKSMKR